MKRNPGQWLHSPPISLRWIIFIVGFWVSVFMLISFSKVSYQAESRVEAPLLYAIRDRVGLSPALDPHLKIYGFDDKTVSTLRRARLSYKEWAELIESLDSRRPKVIIIDALFSVVQSVYDESDVSHQEMVERISRLNTPVVVGAYAIPGKLPDRVPLDETDPSQDLTKYIHNYNSHTLSPKEQASQLTLADFVGNSVYGPEPDVRAAFKRIGHILYGQREGRFYPFLRLSDTRGLPYLMLRAFDDVVFRQGHLFAGGAEIPVSSDGSAFINFSNVKEFSKNVLSMRSLLSPNTRDAALQDVAAGDYVYIIPMHFTGNTDFKPTPIGLIPGAYTHLAVLNSILKKQPLRPIEAAPLLIVLFASAAALLAWWLSPVPLFFSLITLFSLWTGVWIGAFITIGWVFPWLLPNLTLLGVGFSLLMHRTRESERKSQYVRQAFEGAVQPQVLTKLQAHPEKLSFEARERVVSVMFVDIVGFSMMVENQLPRLAFESLRELIESITAIVHEYGGMVNKTLGDGLLCFFGYSFEEDRERSDHAEMALLAAAKIQKSNVPRMIRAARNREPVFPLRIGINTAAVFMGNLGSGQRLDFTVIGNGVNFAKRLEGACMPHSILVGPTTKELVEPLGGLDRAKRRMIAIKHHSEMVEAWEYDPFAQDPELRVQAEEAYRSTTYLTRIERRWTIANPGNITFTSALGESSLVNFSATGMSLVMKNLVSRGTKLEVQLDSLDSSLGKQLSAFGLQKFQVEVRWVQNHENGYLHGVRYLDLDTRQTDLITDLLCQFGLEKRDGSGSREAS